MWKKNTLEVINRLWGLGLAVVLVSCSATKTGKKPEVLPQLSSVIYRECQDTPKVADERVEVNALKNLWGLSFVQAYHRFHVNYDSISIIPVRFKNQELIKSKVTETFPDIELVSSEHLKSMDYLEQMKATSSIKRGDSNGTDIQKLVEKGQGNKQLYIEVVTYGAKSSETPQWENRVNIFVFDLELHQLLYLNEYRYECDPRDAVAMGKVLHYGLGLLGKEK